MRLKGGTFALAAVLCSSCSQPGRLIGAVPAELAMPPGIQVAFNHREAGRYRSLLSGEWRDGDDLERFIVAAIDQAETSLLVAVQELSLARLATSLIAAKQRGVLVQLVLENNYSSPWTKQQPTHLPRHQRHRWHQLEQLADEDSDGDDASLVPAPAASVVAALAADAMPTAVDIMDEPIFASTDAIAAMPPLPAYDCPASTGHHVEKKRAKR